MVTGAKFRYETGRGHEAGPNETPSGDGEASDTVTSRGGPRQGQTCSPAGAKRRYESGRPAEWTGRTRQEPGPDTNMGRAHETRRDVSVPPPARAGKDETGRPKREDQSSPNERRGSGQRRRSQKRQHRTAHEGSPDKPQREARTRREPESPAAAGTNSRTNPPESATDGNTDHRQRGSRGSTPHNRGHAMTATRPDIRALMDDPQELKNYFLGRAQDRDRAARADDTTAKGNTVSKTSKDTREPKTAPPKSSRRRGTKAGDKPRPYRLIYLTEEESSALKEERLTVEELKSRDEDRDDDIPEVQTTTKTKPRGANRTGPLPGAGAAGTDGGTDMSQNEPGRGGQTYSGNSQATAQVGTDRGEDRTSLDKDQAPAQVDTGPRAAPDKTPTEAGDAKETSREETVPRDRTGRNPGGSRETTDADTSRDDTAPPPTRGGEDERGRSKREDQTSPSGRRAPHPEREEPETPTREKPRRRPNQATNPEQQTGCPEEPTPEDPDSQPTTDEPDSRPVRPDGTEPAQAAGDTPERQVLEGPASTRYRCGTP